MRRLVLSLLVFGGVAAQRHSQAPASQVVASIAGRVVDAETGAPITLSASRCGYSRAAFGMRGPVNAPQPFALGAGEHATGATLRMWKNGVVNGRAVYADGDPIVSKYVYAIGVFPGGFRLRPDVLPSALTDDRGI